MEILTDAKLLELIRAFLERTGMKPTRFGRDATGQASLIASLEHGRSPSLKITNKIVRFMADHELALATAEAAPSSDIPGKNIAHAPEAAPIGRAA